MCNCGYWSRTVFKWWYILRSINMIICELIWLLPISYSVNVCAGLRVDGSIFLRSNISPLQWIIYCYCHMMGDNNVASTACHKCHLRLAHSFLQSVGDKWARSLWKTLWISYMKNSHHGNIFWTSLKSFPVLQQLLLVLHWYETYFLLGLYKPFYSPLFYTSPLYFLLSLLFS